MQINTSVQVWYISIIFIYTHYFNIHLFFITNVYRTHPKNFFCLLGRIPLIPLYDLMEKDGSVWIYHLRYSVYLWGCILQFFFYLTGISCFFRERDNGNLVALLKMSRYFVHLWIIFEYESITCMAKFYHASYSY